MLEIGEIRCVVLVIVPGLFFPLIFMVTITGWMLDAMYNFTVVEVGDVVVDVDCDGSTTLTFIASNGQTNVFITESVVYLRRTPFQAWIKK